MPDRLSEDRKNEIYEVVLGLIGEFGFDRVTMEQVAKASHSSTATLYRRWQTKSRLVADALRGANLRLPEQVFAPSASFAEGLHQVIEALTNETAQASQFFIALQFASTYDPELRIAFDETLGSQLFPYLTGLVEAAIERGEFPANHPGLRYLGMVLSAPILVHPEKKDASWDACGGMHGYIDAVVLPSLGLSPLNFSTGK